MPFKDLETARAYRQANREKIRSYDRDYRAKNRERINELKRLNNAKNPERVREQNEKRRGRHKVENRVWRAKNRERIREYYREYCLLNATRVKILRNKRRARKHGALGYHTDEQWRATLERYGDRCFYCGVDGAMTEDHVIPLSRGGSDMIVNIIPACASCNSRKYTKTGIEFLLESWQTSSTLPTP